MRPQVFGSVFFQNLARSIWFVQRAERGKSGEIKIGLYHEKYTNGPRLKPLGLRLVFDHQTTRVENIDVGAEKDLADGLPLLDRLQAHLKDGPDQPRNIGEALNVSVATVRAMVSRHSDLFQRTGRVIAFKPKDPQDESAEF